MKSCNEYSNNCKDNDVLPGSSSSSSSSSSSINNDISRLKENEILQKKSKPYEYKSIINNSSYCNNSDSAESENEKKPLLGKPILDQQRISIINFAMNAQINVNLLYLVLLFICYILIGGLGFEMFELKEEQNTRKELQNLRSTFLTKYPNVNDDDLEDLIGNIIAASSNGISALKNNFTAEYNWQFQEAIFFATTVITTIGYGNIAPTTKFGKIFCMVYATIGIPFTLLFLSVVVKRILLFYKINFLSFNKRLKFFLMLLNIIFICFILIPSLVFTYLETSWTYLDSVYYCFVTFTTIGFGDFVPGDDNNQIHRSLYKICLVIFIILGLILMMLSIGTFSTFPQLNIMHYFIFERKKLNDDNKSETLSSSETLCSSETISNVNENSNLLQTSSRQQQQQRTAYGTIQSSYGVSLSSPSSMISIEPPSSSFSLLTLPRQQAHLLDKFKSSDDCQNEYYYIKSDDDYCLAVSTGLPTYTIVENTRDPFFNFYKLP